MKLYKHWLLILIVVVLGLTGLLYNSLENVVSSPVTPTISRHVTVYPFENHENDYFEGILTDLVVTDEKDVLTAWTHDDVINLVTYDLSGQVKETLSLTASKGLVEDIALEVIEEQVKLYTLENGFILR